MFINFGDFQIWVPIEGAHDNRDRPPWWVWFAYAVLMLSAVSVILYDIFS